MILLIDVGNTRIKWAFLNKGAIQFGGAYAYKNSDFFVLLSEQWGDLSRPTQVMIANVAGEKIGSEVTQWIEQHWGLAPLFVVATAEQGDVRNGYEDPTQLGVDRWVNLIAARKLTQEPVCVVDCGSFLTIDMLDATGLHHGGFISPGLEMLYAGLSHYSQGRLHVEPHARPIILDWGRTTRDCIINGCCQMLLNFINDITEQAEKKLGKTTQFIITGGDAVLLLPWLNKDYQLRPALVFEGLALIAKT